MSTTASSVRQLKTRLTTSNSINNITTNGNDSKSNRNCFKKPISATNGLQPYVSSNGLKSHPLIANHHYHHHQTHQNGKHPMKRSLTHMDRSHSPPVIFHAIAPAPAWSSSLEELRRAHRETNGEPEVIFLHVFPSKVLILQLLKKFSFTRSSTRHVIRTNSSKALFVLESRALAFYVLSRRFRHDEFLNLFSVHW